MIGVPQGGSTPEKVYFPVREAVQTKKRGNLGNGPNRGAGGVVKKVSFGNSSKLGGGIRK